MNTHELIQALAKYAHLPVMIVCDHGQTPENVWSVQTFYRPKENNGEVDYGYGILEDMLEDYDEDELEEFVMIN